MWWWLCKDFVCGEGDGVVAVEMVLVIEDMMVLVVVLEEIMSFVMKITTV